MSQEQSLKKYSFITYILYILGLFTGVFAIVAIIMTYMKRGKMQGMWLESHANWQIKTFWLSFLGYMVVSILAYVLAADLLWLIYLVFALVFIWQTYRLIVGINALTQNKIING